MNVVSFTHVVQRKDAHFQSLAMCQESHERDVAGNFLKSILCQQGSTKEQHYIKH
jgi:hypothetical protein